MRPYDAVHALVQYLLGDPLADLAAIGRNAHERSHCRRQRAGLGDLATIEHVLQAVAQCADVVWPVLHLEHDAVVRRGSYRLGHSDFRGREADEGGLALLQRGDYTIEARYLGHCPTHAGKNLSYVCRLAAVNLGLTSRRQANWRRSPNLSDEGIDHGEVIPPAGRRPGRQAMQLRGAAWRCRKRIIDNGGSPTDAVERVEILRNRPAILAQCREITADDGHPERQRLDERKPKPLGEGRKQKGLSSLDQARHLVVRQIAALDDDVAQRGAAFEHIDRVFGLPPPLSYQHQTGDSIAQFLGEVAPKVEQQQVVLARLDGTDAYEIGRIRLRRPSWHRRRQVDAKRRNEHRKSPTGTRKIRFEGSAGHGRVHNHSVGESSGGLDPAAMFLVLAW